MKKEKLRDEILKKIKNCETCSQYAEAYRVNKIVKECNMKACIYENVLDVVLDHLEAKI